MSINAIIVEDEILAYKRLKRMIEKDGRINIIDYAKDGKEAVEKIEEKTPELIFLDIEMPQFNGFEVLEKLSYMPQVIFTTAYNEYAIKAFDINGLDYLLKPFSEERLKKAITRFFETNTPISEQILENLKSALSKNENLKRFAVKDKNDIIFFTEDDIFYFYAEDKYVFLKTKEKAYFFDRTLKELEEKLNKQHFIRIHRSYIVNINKIKKLNRWFLGDYTAELINGEKLKISKRYYKKLKELFFI